jgi:hypothetical protein
MMARVAVIACSGNTKNHEEDGCKRAGKETSHVRSVHADHCFLEQVNLYRLTCDITLPHWYSTVNPV